MNQDHPENTSDRAEKRRELLKKGGIAAGGAAVFAAGYGEVVWNAAKGLVTGSAGESPAHATRGNSLIPEFRVDPVTKNVEFTANQVISPSMCFGCWSICGVRVRVDKTTQQALRVAGNPYHPLATTRPIPMATPIREAFSQLAGEAGLEARATTCARGSAYIELLNNPHRITQPLKRVGGRGEGKWQTISFEQLITEICEGGNLFGEGQVDGLKSLNDQKDTLIDENSPEFGTKLNQFLFTDASNEGRTPLIQRFTRESFGSMNYANHGSYCGQSYRIGTAAATGEYTKMVHGKPDWEHAEYVLCIGTAPAQSGNPFQRQGRQLVESRTRENFHYVIVNPVLPHSMSQATDDRGTWLPIKPAGDLGLVMGMIRWIYENERYNTDFLSIPGEAAMLAQGAAAFSNATHLVISQAGHPKNGQFLTGADLGWTEDLAEQMVVLQKDSLTTLLPNSTLEPVALDVNLEVTLADASTITVQSAFHRLKESAYASTYQEYSDYSGVPIKTIQDLAQEFTSHGVKASAVSHGGTMHGAGFYTAFAVAILNNLLGNINQQGGWVIDTGSFPSLVNGERYLFADFAGKRKPKGVMISRARFAYEKTSEFQRKKAAGQNPYPARAMWFPTTQPLGGESLVGALNEYPYSVKVWFNHLGNQVYGVAGFQNTFIEKLKDPKHIPLFVAIEPFMNETTTYADYIVPDTVTYESWGVASAWAGVIAKTATARWPVVASKNAKTADGQTVSLESFLIAVAKRLQLPGFGDNALKDKEGQTYHLNSAADFYLRAFANIAYAGKPSPEASDEDMLLTGVDAYLPLFKSTLREEEWRRVAFVMTRGGRFESMQNVWENQQLKKPIAEPMSLWNATVAKHKSAITGKPFQGTPYLLEPHFANGETLRQRYPNKEWNFLAISFKSNMMSSTTIGVDRLRQVHPHNPIALHPNDAAPLGIRNGDKIRVESPYGQIDGLALLRSGLMPGVIAVEHGYGHTAWGAKDFTIDGQTIPAKKEIGAGVNINDIGLLDATMVDLPSVWTDEISGAVVRTSLPVKVSKL